MGKQGKLYVLRGRARAALLIGGLAVLASPTSALAGGGLAGRTIVVDPGHGGMDGGASANGLIEKNITLPIGLDLGALLRGQGASVVYTRGSDTFVSLAERTAIANQAKASAFIAIHVNAFKDPSYRGVMTFYGAPGGYATGVRRSAAEVSASRALATDVQASTVAQTGQVGDGVQPASYYVLGNAAMPAALIETGFLTNPAEGAQLATPALQERIAAGIANGVARFLSAAASVTIAPSPAAGAFQPVAGVGSRYVVQPGDTLSALAVRFDVSEAALLASNTVPSDGRILAGTSLAIPGGPNAQPSLAVDSSTRIADVGMRYTIRLGDSLSQIAVRFDVTEAALMQQNGLRNADNVIAGRRLTIPTRGTDAPRAPVHGAPASTTARHYRVRLGDTLSAVAARFGVTEQAVAQANALKNTDLVYAGRYLTIPAPSA